MERCERILAALMKRSDADDWFNEPVPADTDGYFETIKQPIDYSAIKAKLEGGAYGACRSAEGAVATTEKKSILIIDDVRLDFPCPSHRSIDVAFARHVAKPLGINQASQVCSWDARSDFNLTPELLLMFFKLMNGTTEQNQTTWNINIHRFPNRNEIVVGLD